MVVGTKKQSPLLLSAGHKRFSPDSMRVAFERLEHIFNRRIDIVIPAKAIRMTETGQMYFEMSTKLFEVGGTTFVDFAQAETESDRLREEGNEDYKINIIGPGTDASQLLLTNTAKSQLLELLELPVRVVNKQAGLKRADLIWQYVNNAIARSTKSVLVRVVEDRVRSIKSSKYRCIDSLELLKQTTNAIKKVGADVLEVRVWEDKFQMTAVNPNLQYTLKSLLGDNQRYSGMVLPEDPVFSMIELENDEAGRGGLNLLLGMYTAVCTNYMLLRKPVLAIRHVGTDMSGSAMQSLVISAETRLKQGLADISKMNDGIAAAFDKDKFQLMMEQVKRSADDVIPDTHREAAVKAVISYSNIPKTEFQSIYDSLMLSRDLSRYGLIQAVTLIPEAGRDASVAYKCDRAGGDLLELQSEHWEAWIEKNAKAFDNAVDDEEVLI